MVLCWNKEKIVMKEFFPVTNKNIPVVSAIIERIHQGEVEILIQTRWKPEKDPIYS